MGNERRIIIIIIRRSSKKGALIGITVIRLVKNMAELLKFRY